MKHFLFLTLFGFAVILCLSCRNNRLKTDEKKLVSELILQENEKSAAQKAALEKKMPETGNKTSVKLQFKENHSVDPQKPPIHIALLSINNNARDFRLSDVASSISYVKLHAPPDTALLYDPFFWRSDLMSSVRSDGDQIIFQGIFGLTRFNMQGKYQETVWKNETGIKFYGSSVMFGGNDFFGVTPHTPVSVSNGDIYYSFMDGPVGTSQVMKYKPGTNNNIFVQSHTEIHGPGIIPGDTLLNKKQNPFERFNWIYGIGNDMWAGINQKSNSDKTGSLLVVYNNDGDTICKFTDYEHIINFDHTSYRDPLESVNYYYNGLLTIKQEYNDTVFRLIPPDRLLPIYIIDFGDYKVNYLDGLNPDFDLSDKYLLKSMHETNNNLFIRYTRNNDSPNNRKKNAVKFFNALFNKSEGKLSHQPTFSLEPEGIMNDLDGGMPFWPDFITPQGGMLKLVSGKVLKDYINSPSFKNRAISEEKRQKQISMVAGLKNTDMVIMIVK